MSIGIRTSWLIREIFLALILSYAVCVALIVVAEHVGDGKAGVLVRQKKRVVALKKPFRYNERVRSRQSNYPRGAVASLDELAIVGPPSAEHANDAWKPIPYAHYAENPSSSPPSDDHRKPAVVVNAMSDAEVGLVVEQRVKSVEPPSPPPPPPPMQTPSAPHESTSAEQFEDYALLHYYIPFDQLVSQTSKPIMETLQETPPKQIPVEQLMKAAVEPITVFRLEKPATTATPAVTIVKTEPPVAATVEVAAAELKPKPEEKEEDFVGRYEYEYFVQDNHWGTNFGHKEFRDGKQTRGDYEVVLPDGRVQHVQYWSDATGYHASVTYHPLYKKFKHLKPLSR